MVDKVDSVKKAVDTLKSNDIKWVHSAFVDIRGILQDMVLPAREYISGEAFTAGIGFDGSSVRGFKSIEESDMIYMPDAKTLSIMPWETDPVQKSAIVLGDVYEGNGGKEASVVDPRSYVAKRAVEEASKMGYTSFFAPELEFFVFTNIDPTKLTYDLWCSPKGGEGDSWGAPRVVPESPEIKPGGYIIRPKEAYYRTPPEDTTVAFRNEASAVMDEYFGIEIEKHHHEVATVGQVEIDYKYGPLLDTADRASPLQVRSQKHCKETRINRYIHAKTSLLRQRKRHALPPVTLVKRQNLHVRRKRRIRRTKPNRPLLRRWTIRTRQSINSDLLPNSKQLQASSSRL